MKNEQSNSPPWEHAHDFGQAERRAGEKRTLLVIALTSVMMVVEIGAGILFGSMALLADGLHMASHTAALAINAFAYVYARKHASDPRYAFSTGKVNALGGFSGAVLLAVFALLMAWESVERLINPVEISFSYAIIVAVAGFVVNGISMVVLGHGHDDKGGHGHDDDHGHDHNLRSAYLHVLADALTSLLAIGALISAKYLGLIWIDPVIGIVGALLVSKWSIGLLKTSGGVLLDRQGPQKLREKIRGVLEQGEDQAEVVDLHLWSVGPGIYALIVSVKAPEPQSGEHYRARVKALSDALVHITIEVHQDR